MSDKPTRGRRSKIDLLPEDAKHLLDKMLRDGRNTQVEVLAAVHEYIESKGLPDEIKPSATGLNRYSQRMESIGKDLREVREVSEALISQLGEQPQSELTKLVLEMGRSQLFKAMLRNSEDAKGECDIGMIKDVMLAAQRLEGAAMRSHKREVEIREIFAKEAADAVSKITKKAGISEETASEIRHSIMGLTKK